MDVNEHSLGVDIGDLQVQRFLETEPAGVDRRKESVVVEGSDMSQNPEDLGLAQNTGQPSLLLGPQNGKELPIGLKDELVVELDVGVADTQGFGRPLGKVATKKKVVLKLLFADFFGSFVVIGFDHGAMGDHIDGTHNAAGGLMDELQCILSEH